MRLFVVPVLIVAAKEWLLPFTAAYNCDLDPSLFKDPEYSRSLAFLKKYLPQQDVTDPLPPSYLENNTALALQARLEQSWAAAVPLAIFRDYVLPYASLDEPRDDWRIQLYCQMRPLVSTAGSASEAATVINRDAWKLWGVVFKPNQTPDIMSPFQTLRAGYASCTGLSILLVDALRSVGVPARVVGTVEWVKGGGNHDWVEVWTDGEWSFTGAAEWGPEGWNSAWFYPEPAIHQVPNSISHSIWAASWSPSRQQTLFPMAWEFELGHPNMTWRGVPAYDVTERYISKVARAAEL